MSPSSVNRPSGMALPRIVPVATGISRPATDAAADVTSRRRMSPPTPNVEKRQMSRPVGLSGSDG